MENWTREEKMAYYFWLDDLVLGHWAEYLDLRVDEEDNEQLCEQKLRLIDFYQDMLEEIGKEFTYNELNEWYMKKYGKLSSFARFCKDFFVF